MACDCDQYIDCGDAGMEIGTYDDVTSFGHTVDHTVLLNNPMGFSQKTLRDFSVSCSWDRKVEVSHVLSGCNDPPRMACDNSGSAVASALCKDKCKREINVPVYWNPQQGVCVWKNVVEELSFSISTNKTAAFRTKWGTSYFHKICILNDTKTKGKEQFVMFKQGVTSVLAEISYEYNPFPETEGGGATWGLYGNTIQRSATPDTLNVACILCFPVVPKQAIPLDNDVIAYGFYDYNSIEGGFIESSLPSDDGGKDYFYPYWCRQMPVDPLWRAVADQRYDVIYSAGKLNIAGRENWYASEPVNYPIPVGSFVLDADSNYIISCILKFGERCDYKGAVYNESNIADLIMALKQFDPQVTSKLATLYPASLL